MLYPVVIHKDRSSDYGVTVPDLPGCFSAGETMDAALSNVVEAIECHLEGLLFDGEPIPEATAVETHQQHADYAGGTWALVNVDLSKLASLSSDLTPSPPGNRLPAGIRFTTMRNPTWIRTPVLITHH